MHHRVVLVGIATSDGDNRTLSLDIETARRWVDDVGADLYAWGGVDAVAIAEAILAQAAQPIRWETLLDGDGFLPFLNVTPLGPYVGSRCGSDASFCDDVDLSKDRID